MIPHQKRNLIIVFAFFVVITVAAYFITRKPEAEDHAYQVLEEERDLWKAKFDSLGKVADSIETELRLELLQAKNDNSNTHHAQEKYEKMPLDSNVSYFLQWTSLPAIR